MQEHDTIRHDRTHDFVAVPVSIPRQTNPWAWSRLLVTRKKCIESYTLYSSLLLTLETTTEEKKRSRGFFRSRHSSIFLLDRKERKFQVSNRRRQPRIRVESLYETRNEAGIKSKRRKEMDNRAFLFLRCTRDSRRFFWLSRRKRWNTNCEKNKRGLTKRKKSKKKW